jgi:hypothetical protein
MSRIRFWVAIGVVALVAGALGLSGVMAQRFQPMAMPVIPFGEVGRYQVVSHSPDGVILLDTTNGEVYRAKPEDIKPYSARPRPQRDIPPFIEAPGIRDREKDGPPRDKDGRFEKDEGKKDGDRKDEKRSEEEVFRARAGRETKVAQAEKALADAEQALASRRRAAEIEKDEAKRRQLLEEIAKLQAYTDEIRAVLERLKK